MSGLLCLLGLTASASQVDAVAGEATAPAAPESVIVIDAAPAGPRADAEDTLVIIDGAGGDGEPVAAPAAEPQVYRWRAEVGSRLLVDTILEDVGEDVIEWWSLGKLRLDHRPRPGLQAVAEAWVRWGVAAEDPGREYPFLGVNARDGKWTGEVELREGYLSFRTGGFEMRVGQQLFVWGKNEILAGADVLNPVDLRFDPAALIDAPKEIKVPVFALDAGWFGETYAAEVVLLPFFTPNRGFLIGRDFAVARPGSSLEQELLAVARVHPSIEDELQSAVWGTRTPEQSPRNVSAALRVSSRAAGIDAAATAYYGWDRTPRLRVDPDLRLLLADGDRILADPLLAGTDPELRAASLRLQQKTLAGQELVSSTFDRMWRFALEAQGVLWDLLLRGDVGFTPRRTFYTAALEPVASPELSGALGAEYTRGEEWYAALTGYALVALDAPHRARLLGLEAGATDPTGRDRAALWGASAVVRRRWVEQGLEASASGAYDVSPGDFLAAVELAYDHIEPHTFSAGVVLMGGPAGSLGGRYTRNDFVYVGYRGAL